MYLSSNCPNRCTAAIAWAVLDHLGTVPKRQAITGVPHAIVLDHDRSKGSVKLSNGVARSRQIEPPSRENRHAHAVDRRKGSQLMSAWITSKSFAPLAIASSSAGGDRVRPLPSAKEEDGSLILSEVGLSQISKRLLAGVNG
jgi:hypothetical protein